MFFKVHDPYFSFFKLWYLADVDLWDNHQDLHERNLGFSCVCGAVCMVLQPCSLSCFPQFHTRLGYPFYSFDFQNFQKNSNVIVEHRKPRTHSPPQVDDPLIVWLSPSGLYWQHYIVSQCQTHRGVTWGLDFGYNVMLEIRVLKFTKHRECTKNTLVRRWTHTVDPKAATHRHGNPWFRSWRSCWLSQRSTSAKYESWKNIKYEPWGF